jgi:hypothetical protein
MQFPDGDEDHHENEHRVEDSLRRPESFEARHQ